MSGGAAEDRQRKAAAAIGGLGKPPLMGVTRERLRSRS